MEKKTIIAVIPCYNVEKFCEKVFRETFAYVSSVIAVDDGSTDHTKDILQKLKKENPENFHVVTLEKNSGKGFALLAGFKKALSLGKFQALVTLDSDAQHIPSNLPEIARLVINGADLVIGKRDFEHMPMKSRHSNKVITFLLSRVFPNAPKDTQSGYRGFCYPLVQKIIERIPGGRYEMEFRCLLLALKEKMKIVETPIPTIYIQKNRYTHFSPLMDALRIIRILVLYVLGRL